VRLVRVTSLDTLEAPALINSLNVITENFKPFGQTLNVAFHIRHIFLEPVCPFDQTVKLHHSADMALLTEIELLLPEFRAYATAICASSDDAEDLVQDAIERALRAENRPTVLDELRPWMFRVIRNLHYDELRKRRVRREYLAVEKRLSDEAGTSDAARDILIRMAFERLPPEMREVLCLVDIMGLKYAEAADVMNVANGTVMSRISRARKALLSLLEGKDARGERENSGR
ncbi:MAG: RNA polymerase sigma factor, partial [Pseudomonadota bacterium]